MKLKILALLTILLLTLTACKSTEEPVDDEKPLKLSQRAGTYTCVSGNATIDLVISLDGHTTINTENYTQLDKSSTDTKFLIYYLDDIRKFYEIDFNNSQLTGKSMTDDRVYSMSKK